MVFVNPGHQTVITLRYTNSMESSSLIRALGSLAQPHRLTAFRLLVAAGPTGVSAGAIAKQLGLAASTASHHLGQLENAGLIASTRAGRNQIYRLNVPGTHRFLRAITRDTILVDPVGHDRDRNDLGLQEPDDQFEPSERTA